MMAIDTRAEFELRIVIVTSERIGVAGDRAVFAQKRDVIGGDRVGIQDVAHRKRLARTLAHEPVAPNASVSSKSAVAPLT